MAQRSVFIVGNCQVRPIADVLRMLFPDDEIIDIASWDFSDPVETTGAMHYLRTFDLQIRMPDGQCPLSIEQIGPLPHQQILRIPSITFPAFHPDQVYAQLPGGELFRGRADYHSAIGLWAWVHGATASQAAALFGDEVLIELGYDDYWTTSTELMRGAFEESDLDFAPFWLRVQRLGVFMHTVNHPTPGALALLAKSVAVRLGADSSIWDDPIDRYLTDRCSSAVWPVFPLVGSRLGVRGSWHWRLHENQLRSVGDWLEFSFESYPAVDRGTVFCHRFEDGVFDRVLGPRLEVVVEAGR